MNKKKVVAASLAALTLSQAGVIPAHADNKPAGNNNNKPAATQSPKNQQENKKPDANKPAEKKVAAQVTSRTVGAGYDGNKVSWYSDPSAMKVALDSSDKAPIGNVRVTAQKINSAGYQTGGAVEIFDGSITEPSKEFAVPNMGLASGERVLVNVAPEHRQASQVTLGLDAEAPSAPSMALNTSGGVNHGDTTFFEQEQISLGLAKFSDDGSGVKTVSLDRSPDGGKTWEPYRTVNGAENDKGTNWVIKDSGTYRFHVIDNLGKDRFYGLHDLYNGVQDKVELKATSAPGAVDFNVNGTKPHDGWYADNAKVDITVKSTGWWNSARILVNGQEAVGKKNGSGDHTETYTVDLSKLPKPGNGQYNIDVLTQNMFKSETFSHVVKADFDAPTANLWLESEGGSVEGGTWFTPKAPVFGIEASDGASGVKSVTLNYEGPGGAPKSINVPVGERSVKVDSSGRNFVLVVEDNAGHVTKKTLGGQATAVEFDTTAPTISNVVEPKTVDLGNGKWLTTRDSALGFTIADQDLAHVDAYLNGQQVKLDRNGNAYSLNLSQAGIRNGKVDVDIRAYDKAGNPADLHRTWMLDSEAPSDIKADVHGDVQVTAWGAYARTMPTMQVSAVDNGSGVANYQLLDQSGKVTAESKNGFFNALPAGSTQIRIIDGVGHDTVIPLSQVTSFSQAPTIDPTAPTVKINRPEAQNGNWYGGDFTLTAQAADNSSLKSAQMYVNGTLVSQFEAKDATKSADLTVDTSKLGEPKDGKYSVRVVAFDAAGNPVEVTDEFNIDRTNPEIVSFNFDTTGPQPATASEDYGVFVSSSTGVTVTAKDPGASSGIRHIRYTLRNADGSINRQDTVAAPGGSAYITFPDNFKGYIDAVATDNVGHSSDSVHPYGIVSETSNWHANTAKVNISTPETRMADAQGTPLYDRATTATYDINSPIAGIKQVTYGVGDKTLGTLSPEQLNVTSRDKNLVTGATGTFTVGDEGNSQRLWVRVKDNVGHESFREKNISVDTTAPQINVDYSDAGNPVMRDGVAYYNKGRTARVRIIEKNFDPNNVRVRGATFNGSWVNVGNDTWENTATFNEDGTYDWGVEFTDRAGHAAQPYNSGKFIIDKTAPTLNVDWSDNNGTNEGWYKTNRSATVTVRDVNFDPSGIKYEGNGNLSQFTRQGDAWVATVTWDPKFDGERSFNIVATDIAGNSSQPFNSGKFRVDTTNPVIDIQGVKNGTIYREGAKPVIVVDEQNIDLAKSSVTLRTRNRGDIKLDGALQPGRSTLTLNNIGEGREWDDLYTVSAKIVDKAGNVHEEESQYIIDRHGSQFTFKDFKFKGKFVQKLNENVQIKQESVERIDTKKMRVKVFRDGEEIKDIPSEYVNIKESGGKNSNYVYDVEVSKDLYNGHDGVYQTQLYTVSESGKSENTLKQEYNFGIDATPADVLISGVTERGTYHEPNGKKVTVKVHDLSGVENIMITLNGKELKTEHTDGSEDWTVTIPTSSDPQNLDVAVVDYAGNRSSSHVGEFRVTASAVEAIIYSSAVQFLIWAIMIAFPIALVLFLWWRSRKKREEEQEKATEEALLAGANIRTTTGGSSAADNSGAESVFADSDDDTEVDGIDGSDEDTQVDYAEDNASTVTYGDEA